MRTCRFVVQLMLAIVLFQLLSVSVCAKSVSIDAKNVELPQDLDLQIFYTEPQRDALFSAVVRGDGAFKTGDGSLSLNNACKNSIKFH